MVYKFFTCPWCQYNFNQEVRFVEGDMNINKVPPMPGRKQSLSDQVRCPRCRNFMPSWDKIDLGDGKSIKVRK